MADTTMKKWNGTSWETIYPETTVGQIVASGTPSSSNFLRGDGTWSAPDLSGLATETYVDTAVSNLVDSSPATLDTLNELAAALDDDPNFATTVTNSIAGKVAKTGDTMTGALTMGNNYIYGDLTSTKLRVGSTAEFATVRSMEIRADDDDSSNTEYLKLMAGQNTLQVTSTSGGGTDDSKLTYNGKQVLTSVTGAKRIDLTSQVQLSSYRKSVIALCDLTNTNPSNNSWSGGTIYFHRTNGLVAPVTLQITMEKRYNSVGANYTALVMSGDSYGDNIQYIKFQKNGVWYGGIEFFYSNAELSQVYFIGETNFNIFGLDYYNTQTSSVIDTEVNNSITTSDMTAEQDFFFNGQTIWHSGNAADADTKVSKSGDTMTGELSMPSFKLSPDGSTHDIVFSGRTDYANDTTNSHIWMSTGASSTNADFSGKGANIVLETRKNSDRHIFFKVGDTTNSSHIMHANGNVGIGTTSPDQKLEVAGNAHLNYSLIGRGIRASNRGELFLNSTGATDVSEIFFGYGDGYTENNIRWGISDRGTTGGALNFYRGPANGGFTSVMSITDTLRVGINTTNPGYGLDVNGNIRGTQLYVNDYIYHTSDTNTYIRFVGADDMQLVAGGRQMLRMDEGTDPDRLRFVTDSDWTDSSGNWNMSGGLTVAGNVTSNGQKLAWVRTQGTTNQSGVNFTLSGTTLYISTTL